MVSGQLIVFLVGSLAVRLTGFHMLFATVVCEQQLNDQ